MGIPNGLFGWMEYFAVVVLYFDILMSDEYFKK